MKKLLSTILAMAIILSTFTSCGTGEVVQTNESLTIYSYYGVAISPELEALYREKYPDVELNIVKFTDKEEKRAKLSTSVMAGDGPDLFIYSGGDMADIDIQKQIRAGAFADITPFLEADTEYIPEEYNQFIIDACKTDGKQYIMPTEYSTPTLLTVVKGEEEEYVDLPDLMTHLTKSIDDNEYLFTEEEAFGKYYLYGNYNLVDYSTGEVNLDTPEFKEIAQLYKEIYPQEIKERDQLDDLSVANGVAKYSNDIPFTFISILSGMKIINTKAPADMIAIPNKDGNISATLRYTGAINVNSPNQQNAYNMLKLKFDIDPDVKVSALGTPSAIPIKTTVIEEYYRHQNSRIMTDSMAGSLYMEGLDEKPLEELLGYIERIDSLVIHSPWEVMLMDEMRPFYADEMSLDEAIENATNMLERYISE